MCTMIGKRYYLDGKARTNLQLIHSHLPIRQLHVQSLTSSERPQKDSGSLRILWSSHKNINIQYIKTDRCQVTLKAHNLGWQSCSPSSADIVIKQKQVVSGTIYPACQYVTIVPKPLWVMAYPIASYHWKR